MGDMLQQADLIGFGSLPIVILTGLSVGALLALNSASTLQRFGGITLIGQLVSLGMVTELGPSSPDSWSPAATPPAWPANSAP
jgi:phospholipid/cholesterol/gamma-HCH transport system permease protein